MDWKALLLGAAIVIAGAFAFALISQNDDSPGEKFGEAIEDVGDEIKDRSG